MSATALATLEATGAADVLVDYARFVAGLTIGPDAKRLRRNAARRLHDAHPDLRAWMQRPTPARLADLRRTGRLVLRHLVLPGGHPRSRPGPAAGQDPRRSLHRVGTAPSG